MPEPRLMKMPNGGLLTVEVTLLQLGLSRCRSLAEDALVRIQRDGITNVNVEDILDEIIEESRRTLHEISDHAIANEMDAVVAEKRPWSQEEWERTLVAAPRKHKK